MTFSPRLHFINTNLSYFLSNLPHIHTNNHISQTDNKHYKTRRENKYFGIAFPVEPSNMITITDNVRISLNPCPHGLTTAYETLFCDGLLRFLTELVTTFDSRCDKVSCCKNKNFPIINLSVIFSCCGIDRLGNTI